VPVQARYVIALPFTAIMMYQSSPQFQRIFTSDFLFGEKNCIRFYIYRGADKSLALPGRKQARKHVRDARDFNNIETRAVIQFFPARQGAEGNSRHSDRNISLFPSWSGQGLTATPVFCLHKVILLAFSTGSLILITILLTYSMM